MYLTSTRESDDAFVIPMSMIETFHSVIFIKKINPIKIIIGVVLTIWLLKKLNGLYHVRLHC